MAEEVISILLKNWGLEEYIGLFQEHKITEDVLDSLLEDNNLETLIPSPMGKRLKLKKHLTEYVKNCSFNQSQSIEDSEKNSNTSVPGNNGIIVPIMNNENTVMPSTSQVVGTILQQSTQPEVLFVVNDLELQSTSSFGSEKQIIDLDLQSTSSFGISEKRSIDQTSNEYLSKRKKYDFIEVLNLKEILESYAIGKALISWYNIKGSLDNTRQGYLVELITSHLLNNNIWHLSNSDYYLIALKIVSLFPSEVLEAYYVAPIKKRDSRDNKSGVAKGKLVDKFKNKCTFLRDAGILRSRGKENSTTEESTEVEAVDMNSMQWLTHNKNPWCEVEINWEKTFPLRRQMLLYGKKTMSEIYDSFLILKEPEVISLIAKDFDKIFPGSSSTFYSQFEDVIYKLIGLRKNCVVTATDKILIDLVDGGAYKENQKDYLHFTLFTLLASLLPCTAKFSIKQSNKQWRPKTVDVRDALILRAELPGDVQTLINARKSKLEALGLPLSPFIIALCNGTSVLKIYIICNGFLYTAETMLKAIHVCFMFYHVLHIRYQLEAEHIWYFIQTAVYKIKTKWDKQIPSIMDIVNKVK